MTRQRLKDLATLTRRKGRRAHGQFLVEGVRSVEAAVQAGAPLVEVLVAEAHDDPRLGTLLDQVEAPVWRVPAHDLERLGDAQTSQGVVAVSESVTQRHAPAQGPVVLLDGVQDPGNVGALIRTAAWFGVRTVVLDHASADPESPKAVRASMGGIWDVGVARVPSLVGTLDALAEAGVAVWGADLAGTAVYNWAPSRASALVLGSEAHGLSGEVAGWLRSQPAQAVRTVCIPRAAAAEPGERHAPAGVESLNVAVAGGVLLARWLG